MNSIEGENKPQKSNRLIKGLLFAAAAGYVMQSEPTIASEDQLSQQMQLEAETILLRKMTSPLPKAEEFFPYRPNGKLPDINSYQSLNPVVNTKNTNPVLSNRKDKARMEKEFVNRIQIAYTVTPDEALQAACGNIIFRISPASRAINFAERCKPAKPSR